MRVALIAPLFESVPPKLYGGTERVVHNLCRGLTELGIDVTVYASGDSQVEGHLIPIIDQALRLKPESVKDPTPYYLKMLEMIARQSGDFDVIHNHHDYWMLPLSEMTNTPVLTTMHGRLDLPDVPIAFQSYKNMRYISISDAQRKPLPALKWAKTIHHGISVEDFEFNEKPGNYLAFLGRMDFTKRPDLAIQIAKKSGVPLKIAAKIEGQAMQEYYDSSIKPHVDGKFIEYVGEINEGEKSEFLGNALGLAFPIDWPEPFGLVMIESLACGTPVLARPFGSVPEILADGITGFCDRDADVLAKRVHDLPRISRRACRQWVEKRFSLQRMIEEHLDVYKSLTQFSLSSRRDLLYSVERTADWNT